MCRASPEAQKKLGRFSSTTVRHARWHLEPFVRVYDLMCSRKSQEKTHRAVRQGGAALRKGGSKKRALYEVQGEPTGVEEVGQVLLNRVELPGRCGISLGRSPNLSSFLRFCRPLCLHSRRGPRACRAAAIPSFGATAKGTIYHG
jgi:hypothetical protein